MMKKLLPIVLMFICFYAKGQTPQSKYKNYAWEQVNKNAFSVGADVFGPTKSPYNFGYGVSGKFEHPLVEDLSLTFNAGYVRYHHKDVFEEVVQPRSAASFIPVKAGIKYFLGDSFYFEAESGAALQLNHNSRPLFAIGLSTGYMIKLSERRSLDIQARYENWGAGEVRQTVLRVAYRADWL